MVDGSEIRKTHQLRVGSPSYFPSVPLEGIIPGLVRFFNNHGDRKSPKDRVVGPLPNGLNGLYMGVTNCLLGMILQVLVANGVISCYIPFTWPYKWETRVITLLTGSFKHYLCSRQMIQF